MSKTLRYIFHTEGPKAEPIIRAFAKAKELCKESAAPLKIMLVIPTLQNIQGVLKAVLGDGISKILLKEKMVEFFNDALIILRTERTFRIGEHADIIIGIYIDERILDLIDSVRSAACVMIVHWLMEETKQWCGTWSPFVLGDNQQISERLEPEKELEEGLDLFNYNY